MNKNMKKFETMDMKKLILVMGLPAMFSMVMQALYNLVDSIFVAKISEEALTALSIAFPIQFIIIAIFLGVALGVNSYMSRKLGEQDKDEAINTAEHGLLLGLIVGVIIAILAFIIPRPFVHLFTDDPIILGFAVTYTRIIMLFSVASIITEVCMNILRATGDMVSSMKVQLVGAVINIILDPILIFGIGFIPAMGVRGAAIATVIGQICSLVYGLIIVIQAKSGLKLSLSKFHFKPSVNKEILKVGIPVTFMQILGPVMVVGINMILTAFSATAIAVFGAYFKLQAFIIMPVSGLTSSMMPIVGYNFGAKNYKRMYHAAVISLIYAAIILFIGSIFLLVIPRQLLGLFNSSPAMTTMGISCLRIIGIGFTFSSAVITAMAFFQALGKPVYSLILSFARQIIILLPVAFILSKEIGLKGVWIAFPIAEISCLFLSLILVLKVRNDLGHSTKLQNQNDRSNKIKKPQIFSRQLKIENELVDI